MVTERDRSVLKVLERFNEKVAKTERQVYGYFGLEVIMLLLGVDVSLSRFIGTLVRGKVLASSGDGGGYVLTNHGVEVRSRLREIVSS